MVITNTGLDGVSNIMGGAGSIPGYIAIGSGTTAATTGDTTLEFETDRNAVTSTDTTIAANVTWIADYSSVEVSGLNFTEFALLNQAAAGTMFNREVVGSITFEGDRELQIQITQKYV